MTDALQYAFRALAQRALSEHELRARLHKRDVPDDEAERVVARLRELGYLDDAALAKAASEKRFLGTARIRFELKRRGVEREAVDEALAARDPQREREEARALVERHKDRFARGRDPRARAFAFLARRGYSSDVIWSALAGLAQESAEDADEA